jgi:hypothetical protein
MLNASTSNASADVAKGNAAALRLKCFIEMSSVAKRVVQWICCNGYVLMGFVVAGAQCFAKRRACMPRTARVRGIKGKNTDAGEHAKQNSRLR